MYRILRLFTVMILILSAFSVSAQEREIYDVVVVDDGAIVESGTVSFSSGEVFEVRVVLDDQSEDITANLTVDGEEYFTQDGGAACRSDQGRFIGWDAGEEGQVAARIPCTMPTDIKNDQEIGLVGYQFRNCPEGEESCSRTESEVKLAISGESRNEAETDESVGERILKEIINDIFGNGSGGSSNGGSDNDQGSGGGDDSLRLNTTIAVVHCYMKRVSASYGHGQARSVGDYCKPASEGGSNDTPYDDVCIPWEFLAAIQEKETGVPGQSPYFSSTAQQVKDNAQNACSILHTACPTSQSSVQGGTGGAMGIAQFMPYTWPSYKDAVTSHEQAMGFTAGKSCSPYPDVLDCQENCRGQSNTVYPHPCNIMSALYAMAAKLTNDSGKGTGSCQTDTWTEADVRAAAGRYFGRCEYNGNYYCTDIITKMKKFGYTF